MTLTFRLSSNQHNKGCSILCYQPCPLHFGSQLMFLFVGFSRVFFVVAVAVVGLLLVFVGQLSIVLFVTFTVASVVLSSFVNNVGVECCPDEAVHASFGRNRSCHRMRQQRCILDDLHSQR